MFVHYCMTYVIFFVAVVSVEQGVPTEIIPQPPGIIPHPLGITKVEIEV